MGREIRDKVWNIYKMKGSDVKLFTAKHKSSPLRDMRDDERYERGREGAGEGGRWWGEQKGNQFQRNKE